MKKKIFPLLITVIAGTLLLAGCGNSSDRANSEFLNITDSGMIGTMVPMDYDWGDINIAGGTVMREFAMKNSGDSDLYLKGAATSCMCTTVVILLPDGTISPKFEMHNNIMDWVYAIRPNEEFTLRVTFDPMAHGPEAVGPIQRSVVVISSSKPNDIAVVNPQEKRGTVTGFMLKGNVLSKKDYESMQDAMGGMQNPDLTPASIIVDQTPAEHHNAKPQR